MLRSSRLVPLLTLVVGGLGGWAVASGRLESVLQAGPAPAPEATTANPAGCQPAEGVGCCDVDKARLLAAANTNANAVLQKDGKKPNILVIMGDDVGVWNIGAYHRGMMSGKTPNLDKLASQGMIFTDYYAE